MSASFSPDGSHVVTSGLDATARIWRVDGTGAPLVLREHAGRVFSAEFSADGTRVVTASSDQTVRVWHADGSGRAIVLRGCVSSLVSTTGVSRQEMRKATFSPDGTRVLASGSHGTACVWRLDAADAPKMFGDLGSGLTFSIPAFSPDGTRVLTGGTGRIARVWRLDAAAAPIVLRGHGSDVYSAGFSVDGTRVVTASLDGTARVWRTDGKGSPVVLRGHESAVRLAVSATTERWF